jgi:hypothetical protein
MIIKNPEALQFCVLRRMTWHQIGWERCYQPGLPDFSWHNIPKWENVRQMATKYTKIAVKIPKGLKLHIPTYPIYPQIQIYPQKCTKIWIFGIQIYNLAILISARFKVWAKAAAAAESFLPGLPDGLFSNQKLGKLWRGLEWKMPVYFMVIWKLLQSIWPFGDGVAIWYVFPRFALLWQEKSGNPVFFCKLWSKSKHDDNNC